MMHLSYLHFVILAYFCLRASADCFYPNGTAAHSEQQPCNDSGHSMCCLLNPTSSQNADVCTSDGLCIPSYNGFLFRDTCTDSTWKDPACINICMTGINADTNTPAVDGYEAITTCADGSLCCGRPGNNTSNDCCSKRKGKWLVNGKLVTDKPASLTATQQATGTPTAAASSSTSASASATPTPASSSSNNTGAIVGGVVGGVAGVAILGLAFWYFMIRRSVSQQRNQPQIQSYEPYSQHQAASDQKYWPQPNEAPAQAGHFRGELGTEPVRGPELDSSQVK